MRLAKLAAMVLFASFFASKAPCADLVWNNPAGIDNQLLQKLRNDEQKLDLFCLKQAYPQIKRLLELDDGSKWLIMADGKQIPYSVQRLKNNLLHNDDMDVEDTMADLYPLEPERPDFYPGYSPGRKRSRYLLEALYGENSQNVRKGLASTRFRGKHIGLSNMAAKAMSSMAPKLEKLLADNPRLAPYLVPEGGFYWRKIAGENRLSPHSYGIAMDFGVKVAPYWRWAKINPHPKQKTYPGEIVRIMEDHGFIWGGKWHEYDLMHFEYRPELICKAKIKAMPLTKIE